MPCQLFLDKKGIKIFCYFLGRNFRSVGEFGELLTTVKSVIATVGTFRTYSITLKCNTQTWVPTEKNAASYNLCIYYFHKRDTYSLRVS